MRVGIALIHACDSGEGWLKVTEEGPRVTDRPVRQPEVDTTAANVARVWNYLAGGRDNFKADRHVAQQMVAIAPVVAQVPAAARAYLRRVTTYLVQEAGIRQFLDVGLTLPAADSTHEFARPIAPECRFVYVDSNPVSVLHAQALHGPLEGGATYIAGDVREPGQIVARARETLDFRRPVAVVMTGILNFISDDGEIAIILAALMAPLASGSYLSIIGPAPDDRVTAAQRLWNRSRRAPLIVRDYPEIARWFAGLDIVSPGIVTVDKWRPAPGDPVFPDGAPLCGAVARKP